MGDGDSLAAKKVKVVFSIIVMSFVVLGLGAYVVAHHGAVKIAIWHIVLGIISGCILLPIAFAVARSKQVDAGSSMLLQAPPGPSRPLQATLGSSRQPERGLLTTLAITFLLYLVTLIVFVSDSKMRQSVQSEGQQYFSVNNTNLPSGGLKDDILDIGLNAGPFIGIIVFDSLIILSTFLMMCMDNVVNRKVERVELHCCVPKELVIRIVVWCIVMWCFVVALAVPLSLKFPGYDGATAADQTQPGYDGATAANQTQFGNFHNFCRDSTLPVCNLFAHNEPPGNGYGGCELLGIPLSKGRHLANLGTILLCGIAIAVTVLLLWRSERKHAAVGRREMQLFLVGYLLISLCEIFTVGGIPLDDDVRKGFTAIHLGLVTATTWMLLLNAAVGFQILDDGTPMSMGLFIVSALALFIATGYIALDTGFSWTGHFDSSLHPPNRNIALYVLYQLAPLVYLFVFFVLESILVLRDLCETKPMIYLTAAMLLFAIGQIFQYVISVHICNGTHGKIDGAMFETLFTLASVVMIWVFWSSITEDDWPTPGALDLNSV